MVVALTVLALIKHGPELLRKLADDDLVPVKRTAFDDECDVRKFFAIEHAPQAKLQSLRRGAL